MDLAALGLTVDGRGAIFTLNQFSASASNAGRATEKFERTTRNLTATLGTLGGLLGVRQLVEYADTWTLINARIRVVTKSHEQARTVQQRLYEIAQSSRNTLAATAVLYTRLALNADQLGRSHEELLATVSAVNHAMLISGATGVEAAQGMRQLAQALGAGKLNGDEFRTVMEAMPMVARKIADEMGVVMGQLYELRDQGKITTQIIIDAMVASQKELEDRARSMPVTIGQAFLQLRNSATRTVGILNMATSTSVMFAKAIWFVTDNMMRFVAIAAASVATLVAYKMALMAVPTVMALLHAWTTRAAIQTALLTSAQTVQAFFALARSIRSAADAMALLSLVSGGVIKAAAAVAALTIGWFTYSAMMKKITEATEKWTKAQGDLNDVIGKRTDLVEDDGYLDLLRKTNFEIEDMIRLGHQRVMLAAVEGEAQERLAIRFDAVNRRIEARRDLADYPKLLESMLAAINKVEELELKALSTASAVKAATDAIAEQMRILERFADNVQRAFGDIFYNILNDGIKKFGDLFNAIKQMFFRLLADMAAAKLMHKIGAPIAGVLAGSFGLPGNVTAATATADAMRRGAQGHAVGAGVGTGLLQNETIPVEIQGFTVQASKSWAAALTQVLLPALGGFFIGQMVGNLTTNRGLGAFGGMASGAATGAAIGGVHGAVIGGVAGAIGGWLGASKKQAEETERLRKVMEAHRLTLADNSRKLQAMRDAFHGEQNKPLIDFLKIDAILRRVNATSGSAVPSWGAIGATDKAAILAMANQLGITLLDEEGKLIAGTLAQLTEAVRETIRQMTTFGTSIDELNAKQDAYNKLFNVKDTPQQRLTDTFNLLATAAPDLMARLGLTGLDISTTDGRAILLKGLQEVYSMILSGQLTPELLGAFTDKNQLLDAILRVKDGLDVFDKQLRNVTTDFPRAMDIIYYEQRFGSYGHGRAQTTRTDTSGSGGIVVHGNIVIQNNSNETGEEVLAKVERAAARHRARGGRTGVHEATA